MHGTSSVSSISKFDEDGHVRGKAKSNGCIRHDNSAGERMIAKIIKGSAIENITGSKKDSIWSLVHLLKNDLLSVSNFVSYTPAGISHNVNLLDNLSIQLSYRLWDVTKSDSALHFTLYPDIYGYAFSRPLAKKMPFDTNANYNSYLVLHLKRDLENIDINLSQNKIDSLYLEIKEKIKSIKRATNFDFILKPNTQENSSLLNNSKTKILH